MSAENETANPPCLEETTFASYESSGTSLDYHDLLSGADSVDTGNPFGVYPAILGSNHLVTNTLTLDPTLDSNLGRPPSRKQKIAPKNALRKDTRDERRKRIFQACTRCRDRKAKVCDSSTCYVQCQTELVSVGSLSVTGFSLCARLAKSVGLSVCLLADACGDPVKSAFVKMRISLTDAVEVLRASRYPNNRCLHIVPRLLSKVR
jgi:hypothetical protein